MYFKNDILTRYPILNSLIDSLALKNLSDNTVRNYVDGVARFLDFINYDNSFEITIDHFRNYLIYLNSTNLNKKTINVMNSFLRFFFNAVLDIPVNYYKVPMARVNHKDISILQHHQIVALLHASNSSSRDDLMIKLGLCCGLRINEVASLRICDIHTKGSSKFIHVHDSKCNKSRNVPMDNTIYRAIQRYAKEFRIVPGSDDLLFSFSTNSKIVYTNTIRYHFDKIVDAAGITDITFHCLRHTYAVNFIMNGGNVVTLKYLLGHSSLASTSVYLRHALTLAPSPRSFVDRLTSGKGGNR